MSDSLDFPCQLSILSVSGPMDILDKQLKSELSIVSDSLVISDPYGIFDPVLIKKGFFCCCLCMIYVLCTVYF